MSNPENRLGADVNKLEGEAIEGYQLISFRDVDGFTQEVEIQGPEGAVKYQGNGTVWNQFPSGQRASTRMESTIADLVSGHQMRSRTEEK